MKRRSFIFGLILSFFCIFSVAEAHILADSSQTVSVSIEDHTTSDASIMPTTIITPTPPEIKPQVDRYPEDI